VLEIASEGLFFPQSSLGFAQDRQADAVDIRQHFVVPDTDRRKTLPLEMQISDFVALRLRVLAAIHLNDQPCLEADEVDDVAVERCLPPEFQALQLPSAQRLPENVLGFRGIRAHGAGKGAVRGRDVAMDQDWPLLHIARRGTAPLLRFLTLSLRFAPD
jgi:hypothetical protein